MNAVHCCDCMDFMRDLPDNHYDLAIVDPPYGMNVKGQNPIKNKSDVKDFNTDWDVAPPDMAYFNEGLVDAQDAITTEKRDRHLPGRDQSTSL